MRNDLCDTLKSKIPRSFLAEPRELGSRKQRVYVFLRQRRFPNQTNCRPQVADGFWIQSFGLHLGNDPLKIACINLPHVLIAEGTSQAFELSARRGLRGRFG